MQHLDVNTMFLRNTALLSPLQRLQCSTKHTIQMNIAVESDLPGKTTFLRGPGLRIEGFLRGYGYPACTWTTTRRKGGRGCSHAENIIRLKKSRSPRRKLEHKNTREIVMLRQCLLIKLSDRVPSDGWYEITDWSHSIFDNGPFATHRSSFLFPPADVVKWGLTGWHGPPDFNYCL